MSKQILLAWLNGHIDPPPIMLTLESRMVTILQSNLFQTDFFFGMYAFPSTPNHKPLKYMSLIKKSNQIRIVCLALSITCVSNLAMPLKCHRDVAPLWALLQLQNNFWPWDWIGKYLNILAIANYTNSHSKLQNQSWDTNFIRGQSLITCILPLVSLWNTEWVTNFEHTAISSYLFAAHDKLQPSLEPQLYINEVKHY